MSSGARAGRLLAELTVIVFGVLIALGAESWWSEQQDRAYEAELRADIVEEFRENLQVLLADSTENAEVVPLVQAASQIDTLELLSMPSGEVDGLYRTAAGWAIFDPVSGSAQALVSSAGLWAIDDPDLRSVLVRWAGLLDRYNRYADETVETRQRLYVPVYAEAFSDGEWTAQERRRMRHLANNQTFWVDAMIEVEGLLRDEARAVLKRLETS